MIYKPLLLEDRGGCPQNLLASSYLFQHMRRNVLWLTANEKFTSRSLLEKLLKESKGPGELYLSSCLEWGPNLLGHTVSLRKQCPWQSVLLFHKYLWLFTPVAFQVSSHSNNLGMREQMKYPTISTGCISIQAFSVLQPTVSVGKKMAGYLNFWECYIL